MKRRPLWPLYGGIALISAAVLLFELDLTRLFAVAEWYHFAFLSISIALLGYASSGSFLSLLSPRWRELAWRSAALAFGPCIVGAYTILNLVPFDSYQLAWSPRQMIYLAIYYLGLVIPFLLGSWVLAHWLTHLPKRSHTLYGANLLGSAAGALGLLLTLPLFGGEGTVFISAFLAAAGGTLLFLYASQGGKSLAQISLELAFGGLCLYLAFHPPAWATLRLSPYKSLSQALRPAGARLVYQRWNAFSRVDVVESPLIHSAPGLSLLYRGDLPPQLGLTIDGNNLSPISRRQDPSDTGFLHYLPSAIPFILRPNAQALIIYPRGGTEAALALELGASKLLLIEDNPLIVRILESYSSFTGGLYQDPRVRIITDDGRSALQRLGGNYDLIIFSLSESFHPLASGTYSLSENYLYTVEALVAAIERLKPTGILAITRWLQDPPSESLRAWTLALASLESLGLTDPSENLLAFRSWATMTILLSPTSFSDADIAAFQQACQERGFDLVYYPGISPKEVNRHNVLPEPIYYNAFQKLLHPRGRLAFLHTWLYDITPPTDDRPFFGHYFRWRQVPLILSQLGRTWRPFGGSGFLVVIALFFLAIWSSALFILLPLVPTRGQLRTLPHCGLILTYFAALGMGFLGVELALMQQFILYLGQPAISFVIVVAVLLLFSGLGSMISQKIPLQWALGLLILVIAGYPTLLRGLFAHTLQLSLSFRLALSLAALAPLGLLLGIPFAGGIANLKNSSLRAIPWVWAVNGSMSVVGSLAATIVALSWGYRIVLWAAAGCYALAWIASRPWALRRKDKLNAGQ